MKKNIVLLGMVIGFFLTGNIAVAGNDIILPKDLFKIMNNKEVVILSTQNNEEYQKVHVKNAIHINLKELYNNDPIKSLLKPPADLAQILGDKGVFNTATIVVYDQGSGRYSGRLYWILKYLGCENVSILNGQLKGWMDARKPITKNPTPVSKTTFTPNVNKSIYATIADVKSGKYEILDVRSTGEFEGTTGEVDPKGHIPGAKNIEYKAFLTDKGSFKSKEEIESIVGKTGITADNSIILYCTSSVRAGIVYAALTNILGYPNVKVYEGALYEWVAKGNKVD